MVAAAAMGACFGFLWWNASPAKIFMGDTGSLALGGALAGLAITTRTELLVVILGGLFVTITLSVIIQVGSFKLTGKRVFRMAPLQHHFELLGLERGHHRHPVLDHRRAVRRARARACSTPSGWWARRERSGRRRLVDGLDGLTGSRRLERPARWSSPGSGSAASRRPTRCTSAVPASSPSTAATRDTTVALGERARILDILGVDVRLGRRARRRRCRPTAPPTSSSPRRAGGPTSRCSWPPQRAGIPVWGEVELAWRMRAAVGPGALAHRHRHQRQDDDRDDARARCCGPPACGRPRPATSARRSSRPCCTPSPTTSSRSSCRASSCTGRTRSRRYASACLNVAPDHLDWHGSLEEYPRSQGQGLRSGTKVACVYNVQDPVTEQLVMDAEVQEGCRAIGFTLGTPGAVDGRASSTTSWPTGRSSSSARPRAAELGHPRRRAGQRPDARAAQRSPTPSPLPPWPAPTAWRRWRSATGCAPSRPEPHRIADAATVDGVRYVDDSKATNPHAAAASLAAFEHVVWVAGGLLKGADVDDLVRAAAAGGCAASSCIGADRARLAEALARHAPDVPVVDVPSTDTGVMDDVVARAAGLAAAGRRRAARARRGVDGHVPQLRGPRRRVRRGRAPGGGDRRPAGGVAVSSATAAPGRGRVARRDDP